MFVTIIAIVSFVSWISGMVIMTNSDLSRYETLGMVLLSIMGVTAIYAVYGFIRNFPNIKFFILKNTEQKPFWNRLLTEYGYRAVIFSICSFVLNMTFTIYNAVLAFSSGSIWFGALSAYYAILMTMRGSIIGYHLKRRRAVKNGQDSSLTFVRDTVVYKRIGILLTFLPFVLSFAIASMVLESSSFSHRGMSIYAFAFYAFYKVVLTVIRYLKNRKSDEITVKAITDIGLADAMVSLLALQSSMLKEFNTDNSINASVMNAITGAFVCIITLIVGIAMILKANANIKKAHQTKDA